MITCEKCGENFITHNDDGSCVESESVPPEEWTTSELFDYCYSAELIEEDAEFEDWMHCRSDMLSMVENHIAHGLE